MLFAFASPEILKTTMWCCGVAKLLNQAKLLCCADRLDVGSCRGATSVSEVREGRGGLD